MKDTPPVEHIDPTKYKHEYMYCCGTTCDKFKVGQQFVQLRDELSTATAKAYCLELQLTKVNEVIDEYIKAGGEHPREVITAIAFLLT